MTAKQNKREEWAKRIERMVGPNSASRQLRSNNRKVDQRKRRGRSAGARNE